MIRIGVRAGRRTRLVRLAVAGVVAALFIGLTWSAVVAHLDPAVRAVDPARVSVATAMLASLPPLSGTSRDLTSTACFTPATYCLTSATATPQQMFGAAGDVLRGHGARMHDSRCVSDAALNGMDSCDAYASFHGARISVEAGRAGGGRAAKGSWLRAWVDEGPDRPRRPSAPLGAWSALGLLPPGWSGSVPCVGPTPLGARSTTAACAFQNHRPLRSRPRTCGCGWCPAATGSTG